MMNKETKICPFCGEEILAKAKKCKHCGEFLDFVNSTNKKPLPPELKKYNWGPFFMGWIWGVANGMPTNVLITLIVLIITLFIPIVDFITIFLYLGFIIWCGTKGNEWAWNDNNWKSVDEFNTIQRRWVWIPALAIGLGLFLIIITELLVIGILLLGMEGI